MKKAIIRAFGSMLVSLSLFSGVVGVMTAGLEAERAALLAA